MIHHSFSNGQFEISDFLMYAEGVIVRRDLKSSWTQGGPREIYTRGWKRRYSDISWKACFHPRFDVNETGGSYSSNRSLHPKLLRGRQQSDAIKIFHRQPRLFHGHLDFAPRKLTNSMLSLAMGTTKTGNSMGSVICYRRSSLNEDLDRVDKRCERSL